MHATFLIYRKGTRLKVYETIPSRPYEKAIRATMVRHGWTLVREGFDGQKPAPLPYP